MFLRVFAIFLLSFSLNSLAAEAPYGIFMVVKGDVKVLSTQGGNAPAKIGGRVLAGETVTTGPDSRAKIVMSDKNVLNVSPDSKLKIEHYENDSATGHKNVLLKLDQGKVRANVEQKYDGAKNRFLIKTPTAVAGVRGTQFMTSFNPATKMTEIVTFKGAVSFNSINANGIPVGPAVIVKKGQTTSLAPGATVPATPKSLPKEDLRKADTESTASNLRKETDNKLAEQKDSDKKSNEEKSPDHKGTNQQASGSSNSSTETPVASAPPPPPKMIDQKDLSGAAPDMRMPATVDTTGGIVNQMPPPPPSTMAPPAAMMPPPQNPLLNTIISNKVQNTNLIVTPVPK
jgi:hypothetical protein